MKPHPRIRKTIKWGGAVVTVLLVVVWIGSGWYGVKTLTDSAGRLSVWAGRLEIDDMVYASNTAIWPNWDFFSHTVGIRWTFESDISYPWASRRIPLWFPISLLLVPTVAAWRLDTLARRRAKLNRCPKCNYDRTGILKDAKCPECGSVPA